MTGVGCEQLKVEMIVMAQYEVFTNRLNRPIDGFASLSAELDSIYRRLDAISVNLDVNMHEIKRPLLALSKSISGTSRDARRASDTLLEVSRIYGKAERSAFGDHASGNQTRSAGLSADTPPQISKTSRVLMFGDVLLPEWLQSAVLEYERIYA